MAATKKLKPLQSVKVCIITGSYPPQHCGIGDYSFRLANAFYKAAINIPALNFEIYVVTSSEANFNNFEKNSGPTVVGLIKKWNWHALGAVIRWVLANLPSIIHFQYPTASYGRHPAITVLPLLLRCIGIFKKNWSPVFVLTVHEYNTYKTLGKIRIWLMALGCQSIICVSSENLKVLKILQKMGKKVVLIPVGNNVSTQLPAEFEQAPDLWKKDHGLDAHKPIISYFGFISPNKGLTTLIKAFALLERDAQLLLIAEPKPQDENYRPYLEHILDLIAQSGIEQKVKWTGFASESNVAAFLQSSTLAVFPFVEGVSLRRTSLLAAMANNVPVISTRPPQPDGIYELEPGKTLLLVPPGKVEELLKAMESLLDDSVLRTNLSRNGQNFISRFSWPEIVLMHINLYRELTGSI